MLTTFINRIYAQTVNSASVRKKVNFRLLVTTPSDEDVDVVIPLKSVLEASKRYENNLHGYFLGKRIAFLVVQGYVMNAWKKYGIEKVRMNSRSFFSFSSQLVKVWNRLLKGVYG